MQAPLLPPVPCSPTVWGMDSAHPPSPPLPHAFLVMFPDGTAQLYDRQHMTAGDVLADFPNHCLSLVPSRPRVLIMPDTALLPHNTYYLHPTPGSLASTTAGASSPASGFPSRAPSESPPEAGAVRGRAASRFQRRHGLSDQFHVGTEGPQAAFPSSSSDSAAEDAAADASLAHVAPGIVDPAFAAAASQLMQKRSTFPGPLPQHGSISQPFTRMHSAPRTHLPEDLHLPKAGLGNHTRKPSFLDEEDVPDNMDDYNLGSTDRLGEPRIHRSPMRNIGAPSLQERYGQTVPKCFGQYSEAFSRLPPLPNAPTNGCSEDYVLGQLVPARRAVPRGPQNGHPPAPKVAQDDTMEELHRFLNQGRSRGPMIQRTMSSTAAATGPVSGTHTWRKSNSIVEELAELEAEDLTLDRPVQDAPPAKQDFSSGQLSTQSSSRRSLSIAEELKELEAEDLRKGHSLEIPIRPTVAATEKDRSASGSIIAKLSARFSKQVSCKSLKSKDDFLGSPHEGCAAGTSPVHASVQKRSSSRKPSLRTLHGPESHTSWNAAATFYSFAGVGSRNPQAFAL